MNSNQGNAMVRAFSVVQHEIEVAFSELIHGPWGRVEPANWRPNIDLYESAEAYTLIADLPGADYTTIDLRLEGHRLTVCGTRRNSRTESERGVVVERHYGRFCRTIPLHSPVEFQKVQVTYENGIYKAVVPKRRHSHLEGAHGRT